MSSTTIDSSLTTANKPDANPTVGVPLHNQTSNTSSLINTSPILTTAAKSSVSSTYSSIPLHSFSNSPKKSRKNDSFSVSEHHHQHQPNNYLPVSPQTFFQTTNQGLALASVHQQLHPGSVVFTSPPMAMATITGAGPQATVQQQATPPNGQMAHQQQQLVVTPTGQMTAPQFSGTFQTNGQTQLIQTPTGMSVMGGLPQVQVINTNGQPYFGQFYTGQMQPMLLNNLTMTIPQNTGQSLAIQLPNAGQAGQTMITGQMTQTSNPTTPVKNQTNQTTIMKGVTISPQQTNKNNANNGKGNQSTSPATATQQTILQQTTSFQQNSTNQTFVIGLQGQNQNGSATILPQTPTNARKSMNTGRPNNSNKNSNMIQKIQPATSSLLATSQFKPNTSFGSTTNAGNSAAAGQTIMVHGQGIQTGTGGIQLTSQPTIISPLSSFQTIQPSITWTSPHLNQQSTQLVAPNGQILIRTQGPNDSQHMLIQTSQNPFQAVPMQMTSTNQAQSQTGTGMQVTQAGQPMMANTINQTLPISIQTNQTMPISSSNAIVTQVTNSSTTNMLTVVTSSNNATSMNTATTMSTNNKQRPLRPASTQQTTISTQTTTSTKSKASDSLNRSNGSGNVPKLAPKGAILMPGNSVPKLPLPALPKSSENGSLPNTTVMSTNTSNNAVNKTSTSKISAATQSLPSSLGGTTSVTTTTSLNSSNSNLVSTGTNSNKIDSNKQTIRKTEKRDAASGTENKSTILIPPTNSININCNNNNSKSILKSQAGIPIRNSCLTLKNAALLPQNPNLLLNKGSNNNSIASPITTTSTVTATNNTAQTTKNSTTNGSTSQQPLVNGVLTKSNSANTPTSNSNNKNTNGNKPNKMKNGDSQVLTHVIDGFIIQESASPFPIMNGFHNSNELEILNNSTTQNGDVESSKEDVEHKVADNNGATQNNVAGKHVVIKPKEIGLQNSLKQHKDQVANQQQQLQQALVQQQPSMFGQASQTSILQPSTPHQMNDNINSILCIHCGKNERMQNKKNKWKKYCQTCIDKKLQEQSQMPNKIQNSSSSALALASLSTQMNVGPNTASHTTTTATTTATAHLVNGVGLGMAATAQHSTNENQVNHLSQAATATANNVNGRMTIMKRPLNQPVTANENQQVKRQRLSNSLINKSAKNINSDPMPNGTDGKTDSINNNNNNVEQVNKMWLPAGGTKEPNKWTVQEVFEFISHLEGCTDLAEGFKTQEIDGQALMLIKEDHIIDILNTKLGPALKICRKIKELKEEFNY